MALVGTNTNIQSAKAVVASSIKTSWIVIHTDARTANSATEIIYPQSISNSGPSNVARVPEGTTRIQICARFPIATSSKSTDPIIRVFGYAPVGSTSHDAVVSAAGVVPSDGTVKATRLDAATVAGTGTTLTLAVTGITKDAAYFYSDIVTLTGTDVLASSAIQIAVVTAASITASAAVEILVAFMN